jgi:hypothetical protein
MDPSAITTVACILGRSQIRIVSVFSLWNILNPSSSVNGAVRKRVSIQFGLDIPFYIRPAFLEIVLRNCSFIDDQLDTGSPLDGTR